jgi:hypothetical protein
MRDELAREHAAALAANAKGIPGAIAGALRTDAELSREIYRDHPETLAKRMKTLGRVLSGLKAGSAWS